MKMVLRFSALVGVGFLACIGLLAAAEPAGAPADVAVARTRKSVRMLDDIYKTAIVLITDKYVNSKDDFPAGGAAVEWFKQISQKGWHDVRLLDATGQPESATNVAKDDFEREGIKSLKLGKDFVEKVEKRDGKYYLRAMTPVPVVMKKCALCHPHYTQAKPGEAIGALSYTLAIE